MADVATLGIHVEASGAIRVVDQFGKTVHRMGQQATNTERQVLAMGNSLQRLAALAGTVFSIQQLIQYADTWKLMEARIKLTATSAHEVAVVQERLFAISQRTRTSLEGTTELYSRLARVGGQLNRNSTELLRFTETVQQAIQVGGASAMEAAGGVRQLTQALASGRLSGDEFRSVMENLPGLSIVIAKGLKEIGVASTGSVNELYKLRAEGKLTADNMVSAILKMGEATNKEFAKIPLTIGQSFTLMNNVILKTVGEIDKATGASAALSKQFRILADNSHILVGAIAGITTALGGLAAVLAVTLLNPVVIAQIAALATIGVIIGNAAAQAAIAAGEVANYEKMLRSFSESTLRRQINVFATEIETITTAARENGNLMSKEQRERYNEFIKLERDYRKELASRGPEAAGGGKAAPITEEQKALAKLIAERERELAKLTALNAAYGQSASAIKILEIQYAALEQKAANTSPVLNRLTDEMTAQRIEAVRLAEATEAAAHAAEEATTRWEAFFATLRKHREDKAARNQQVLENAGMAGPSNAEINASVQVTLDRLDDIKERWKEMLDGMQKTMAQFFSDVFTKGIKSFGDLFSTVKNMFLRLVAEMAAASLVKKMAGVIAGLMGGLAPKTAGAQEGAAKAASSLGVSSGTMAGFGAAGAGAMIGYGIGSATGSRSMGALGGAAGGFMAGNAILPGVGGLIGGLAGLAGGLFGAGKAAKAAAKEMAELQKSLKLSMDAYRANIRGDSLAQDIAASQAALQAMLKQISEAYKGRANETERFRLQREAKALQAEEEKRIRERHEVDRRAAQEDLQVRLLRAQGRGAEADALALALQHQREYAAAVAAGADAAHLAALTQVLAAEKVATAIGTLQDAVRNAPSGFSIETYGGGQYRAGASRGGLDANAGTARTNPVPVTVHMEEGAIVIDGTASPQEMAKKMIQGLREFALSAGGAHMPLSSAMEVMS